MSKEQIEQLRQEILDIKRLLRPQPSRQANDSRPPVVKFGQLTEDLDPGSEAETDELQRADLTPTGKTYTVGAANVGDTIDADTYIFFARIAGEWVMISKYCP